MFFKKRTVFLSKYIITSRQDVLDTGDTNKQPIYSYPPLMGISSTFCQFNIESKAIATSRSTSCMTYQNWLVEVSSPTCSQPATTYRSGAGCECQGHEYLYDWLTVTKGSLYCTIPLRLRVGRLPHSPPPKAAFMSQFDGFERACLNINVRNSCRSLGYPKCE